MTSHANERAEPSTSPSERRTFPSAQRMRANQDTERSGADKEQSDSAREEARAIEQTEEGVVTASSDVQRKLTTPERRAVQEPGASVASDELGPQFLSDATQQGNFESSKLAEGPLSPENVPEEPLMTEAEVEQLASNSKQEMRDPRGEPHPEPVQRFAHLTVSPEEVKAGKLCSCEACTRDGQHEPDCAVHHEPRGGCSCDVAGQRQGAS